MVLHLNFIDIYQKDYQSPSTEDALYPSHSEWPYLLEFSSLGNIRTPSMAVLITFILKSHFIMHFCHDSE